MSRYLNKPANHETNITNEDSQKKHRLGTVIEINSGGLKFVQRYQPHP